MIIINWAVLAVLAIVLIAVMLIYIIRRIMNFTFMSKIKNKYLKLLLSFLPIILLFVIFNMVDAMIVIFHLFIFLVAFDLINKLFKNKHPNLFGFLAVGVTIIYLGIGAYLDYTVFETNYDIVTSKDIGFESFKIIQISDSHIGATFDAKGFKKHIEKISKIDADIVVITGDFIDDDTSYEDMVKSCEALSLLKPRIGVYFVYGNHDSGYSNSRGYTAKELEDELTKNNVFILKDQISLINDKIYIVGRLDRSFDYRKSIKELVADIEKDKYIIDLNHQPNDFENEEKSGVDLVLSGHSHGGQIIPLGIIGKLMGENEEYYGLHKRGNTTFIVNSGISNWKVSFKTGTKSEYSIITIRSTYEENNPL